MFLKDPLYWYFVGLNCIHEITTEVLATADLLNPRWF
jgi:hypothetical protein